MAFSNQFSLSVELSNLVPLAPIVNLASRSMLEVVRGLHKSGSDLATEHDLAEILGRSYIEPRFVRNFKNAVRESTIRKLSGIAELVLEAGAGPTVRNAVGDAAMFSMVVQLSLLLWAHHTRSLATGLTKALEARNSSVQNAPRLEDIMGTLRCISQQTTGFMWELVFAAVDAKLREELEILTADLTRAIPQVVLRTLLDALPAVQRFPESHTLLIRTTEGVATLIVWAHHVLGLTVEARSDGHVLKFGQGPPAVQIDRGSFNERIKNSEVVLLNETEDVIFQATVDALNDPELEPAAHHTLEGYGSIAVQSAFEERVSIRGLATRIIQSCLLIVEEGAQKQVESNSDITGGTIIASQQRILTIGRMMFPAYDISLENVEGLPDRICLASADWSTDEVRAIVLTLNYTPDSYHMVLKYLRPVVKKICHIILALSTVRNIQDCREVPLSTMTLPKETYQVVGLLNVEQAFETLAYLFMGYSKYSESADHKGEIKRAVVISHRGWSLCISSIGAPDPGMLYSEVAIVRGVPTRGGDRREWIQDHTSGSTWDTTIGIDDEYTVVASEGDRVSLESFWPLSDSKYSIGTITQSFLVFKTLTCYDSRRETSAYLRVGLRYLQSLYWKSSHVPPCEHVSQVRDVVAVPHRTWVFRGLLAGWGEAHGPGGPWAVGALAGNREGSSGDKGHNSGDKTTVEGKQTSSQTEISQASSQTEVANISPQTEATKDATTQAGNPVNEAAETQLTDQSENAKTMIPFRSGERIVHLSQSAGNSAVRWLLLRNAESWLKAQRHPNFAACYLRNPECCVECAIRFIQERRREFVDEHVVLIT